MNLFEAALKNRTRVFAVFPLASKSKVPIRGSRSFKAATHDSTEVSRMWEQHPSANVGVRTGEESHCVVLDVDLCKEGCDLTAFEKRFGPLPKTFRVKTPHGLHVYMRVPTEVRIGCHPENNGLGTAIGLKGEGG